MIVQKSIDLWVYDKVSNLAVTVRVADAVVAFTGAVLTGRMSLS